VLYCNLVCISSHFRDNGPQTYWGHDNDISRSRAVIDHVIIWFTYWCPTGTESISSSVFEIFGLQNRPHTQIHRINPTDITASCVLQDSDRYVHGSDNWSVSPDNRRKSYNIWRHDLMTRVVTWLMISVNHTVVTNMSLTGPDKPISTRHQQVLFSPWTFTAVSKFKAPEWVGLSFLKQKK